MMRMILNGFKFFYVYLERFIIYACQFSKSQKSFILESPPTCPTFPYGPTISVGLHIVYTSVDAEDFILYLLSLVNCIRLVAYVVAAVGQRN